MNPLRLATVPEKGTLVKHLPVFFERGTLFEGGEPVSGSRVILGRVAPASGASGGYTPGQAAQDAVNTSSSVFSTEDGRESPVYGLLKRRPRRAPCQTADLAPGIRLQVAEGIACEYANIGTDDMPVWLVTPGERVGVLREDVETGSVIHAYDATGILPLLILAVAKPVAKAVEKHLRKEGKQAAKAGGLFSPPTNDVSGALLIDTDGKRVLT